MKYSHIFRIWALLAAFLVVGCSKDEPPVEDPFLTVSTQSVVLTPVALTQSFEITTNRTWSIQGAPAWLTISPTNGEGGKTRVELSLPEASYGDASCELTVKGAGVSIPVTVQKTGLSAPAGSELAALISFYQTFDGPNWTNNTNWLTDKPLSEWRGIQTDEQGHVTSITFYRNKLTGQLPPEIGDFPYLETLYLSGNQITGAIPEGIGRLSRLKSLDLTNNKFSGSLPEGFYQLRALEVLALAGNQLSGTLSEQFGNLSRLTSLTLSTNRFSGPIPASIGNLTHLEASLNLGTNEFSGTIPDGIGNLPLLKQLRLEGNSLSGTIPGTIGQLGALELITMQENKLEGAIPETIGLLTHLTTINLSKNNLDGGLPESMANLANLVTLDFTFNRFTSAIPASVMAMPRFEDWAFIPQQSGFKFSNLDALESDDYSRDGEVIHYQSRTTSEGMILVFMGDGFTSQEMGPGGRYEQKLTEGIEGMFSYEPYKTYRSYFDIYIVKAVSPQQGITLPGYSRNTALGFGFQSLSDRMVYADFDKVRQYAGLVPGYDANGSRLEIAVVASTNRYGGTCYYWNSDSPSIALQGLGSSYISTLIHEMGGHAIGRLGDEYEEYSGRISAEDWGNLSRRQEIGYFLNLSLSNNLTTINWSHFSGRSGYEAVGAYEGGYYYRQGVWRPEQNSIMRQSGYPDFNAPSRELIVKRIKEAAGEGYSFADFLSRDVIPPVTKAPYRFEEEGKYTAPPVFMKAY